MSFKNKTNQKLISALLIILVLIPSVLFFIPKNADAQTGEEAAPTCIHPPFTGGPAIGCPTAIGQVKGNVWTFLTSFFTDSTAVSSAGSLSLDAKQWAKEILRETLRTIARRTLQQMTQSTVSWINTGFHGAPLFVERPGAFFKDIAKSEIKDLVNIVGHDSSKFPFGRSAAISTIEGFKSTFEQNAQYSLSKVTNDPALIRSFQNDFSVGGWDGFLLTTQFPQNNPIGFQMTYADELARRLRGTNPTQTDIVKDTLQQGQGFLSPQTCPSNPQYNNLKNQFQQPTFKPTTKDPILQDCDALYGQDPEYAHPELNPGYSDIQGDYNRCVAVNEKAMRDFREALAREKAHWDSMNSCPGGLVNTTPGSVVGASIIKAITGPYDQTSLAAAMGNSLSAVFDALLNKFMSSGLNALSNKLSGSGGSNNTNDNFDYDGHTLGTDPNTGTTTGVNWGVPDEIIVLSTFKKNVKDAISNGNQEIKIIDGGAATSGANNVTAGQGILQVFDSIWPKTQELDTCLPGPNRGWEPRLDSETRRSDEPLQLKMSDPDAGKAAAATKAHTELASATNSFKSWITNKMNTELPGSRNYGNTVNSIDTINDQADELRKREDTLTNVLVTLNSINSELNSITSEPTPGTAQEANLIRLKQRYNDILLDIPTATTVNDAKNKLDNAKAKLANLGTLIAKCEAEKRTVYGDNIVNNPNADKERFCSLPIVGGYSHTPFINNGSVTYPAIPLVNASNVYHGSGATGDNNISISISCDAIYRTDVSDYKKSVPSII